MAINWNALTAGFLNPTRGAGEIIGGIGGLTNSQFLKDVGGQLTGGSRTFNFINPPSTSAQELPAGQVAGMSTGQMQSYPSSQTTSGGTGGTSGGTPTGGDTGGGGPSAEDILRSEVSSIFDPVFAALSGQEGTLATNYGITQGDINQQANTAKQSLATQNTQGLSQLNQLGTEAGQTRSDALTAATRLYNELSRGGQQRFGGASSAGEAFGALTAVEQQRRQGTIQTAYDTAIQKIASYKNDLVTKYQDSVAQLESQKMSALSQAQQQFNDAMQQIQSAKNQAQSDKASATLQTLQDYRNKVYTINLQAVQFAQTLAANKEASLSAVDNYTQQVLNNLGSGQQTYQNLGGIANTAANTSGYGNIGVNQVSTAPQYTGQIQSRPGQRWDPITQKWVSQ